MSAASTDKAKDDRAEDTLLVAVLDGSLHALDAKSGNLKWSFASGPPLLSTSARFPPTKTHKNVLEERILRSNESEEWDDDGLEYKDILEDAEGTIFPGIDGGLYTYQKGKGLLRLPVTARDLVESSPSVTRDGALVVGASTSTVFLVDATSGTLLRRFDATGDLEDLLGGDLQQACRSLQETETPYFLPEGMLSPGSSSGPVVDAAQAACHLEGVQPLLVMRRDYTVRAIERKSGVLRWNVTVGELATLANMSPILSGSSGQSPLFSAESWAGMLESGKDNSLRRLDSLSGEATWSVKFSSTPTAVFSPSGVLLQQLQQAHSAEQPRSVYLGLLDGQVYVLPLPPASTVGPPLPMLPNRPHKVTQADGLHHAGPLAIREYAGTTDEFACAPQDGGFGFIVPALPSLPPGKVNPQPPAPGPQAPPTPPAGYMVTGVSGLLFLVVLLATLASRLWSSRHKNAPAPKEDRSSQSATKKRRNRRPATAPEVEGLPERTPPRHKKAEVGQGTWVGRLLVQPDIIGYGSHGTLVLEGQLEGRPVAVKRLLGQFYDKARKEIAALIASDEHPNVVRCFAMEEDADFVYVALERCSMSLADLVLACSKQHEAAQGAQVQAQHRQLQESLKIVLWDEYGWPTQGLLQLMRDMVAGLAHLHDLGIVHRDLKPHNVLVSLQPLGQRIGGVPLLRAKLSDMGISKHLMDDASSFDPHTTGLGSSGWQAPEQLQHGRQTRSVDVFALGCVIFFCVSGGQHPFGTRYERDANILRGQWDLFPVEHIPEAAHLMQLLLSSDPSQRLMAAEVAEHPLLWDAEKRLSFLRDASDRVEGEDREEGSQLLAAMEAVGPAALGGPFDERLDSSLLDNLGRYRRYNFRSVRDLLRVIRNKCNHYRELPLHVQELLGPVPEGYERYFRSRFPRLLIEVYAVLQEHSRNELIISRYFYKPLHPAN